MQTTNTTSPPEAIQWQIIPPRRPGDPPPSAVLRKAKQQAIKSLGRRWTWRHDIAAMKCLLRWGEISAEEFANYKAEYVEERETRRLEAGLPVKEPFRVY